MPRMYHRPGPPAAGPKVMLATPVYGGMVAGFAYALFHSSAALSEAGIAAELALFAGDCHVDDARNRLVRQFLKGDCTDLVFLDADLRWNPDDLVELCRCDRDVVGAAYPLKQDVENYPVRFLSDAAWSDRDGLIEVEGLPTGFLKIRRNVLERLAASAEKYRGKKDGPSEYTPLIFERSCDNGTRWGGDYTFCRKWRAAGGRIYLMPEAHMEHIGERVWAGSLGDFLRRRAGRPGRRFAEAVDRLAGGDDSPDVFAGLISGHKWTMPADGLLACYELARAADGPVLECGSGVSTLVMAMTGAEVHALEHDLFYARRTQEMLNRHGASAHVHYAPLDAETGWYGVPEALPDRFGLVVIDGPPRDYGREGVFTVLRDRIGEALWLADDVDDPAYKAMLEQQGRDVIPLGAGRLAICMKQGER